MKVYDLIIIGAGPAGLAASIYASRYKISNLVIGSEVGGTITKAHLVENYPGFNSIPGLELGQKIGEQVKRLGAEIILENVVQVEKKETFIVHTTSNKQYQAKTIIVASGTERRKLDIRGESQYLGRGVSYCTNCDAPFFKDKRVVVVGGGDAAVTGALHLEDIAKEVYLMYRRKKDELRAEPAWLEKLESSRIQGIYETNVIEILGDGQKVTGVKLDVPSNGKEVIPLDGVFIEIGAVPVSKLVGHLGVEVDEGGFIKVNNKMETNVDGVYAAGDITQWGKILQQMITATAEGAIAASSVFRKIKSSAAAPKQWG
jgi:thioredoxin reductase (NADPH)